jgi:hypothetical protein
MLAAMVAVLVPLKKLLLLKSLKSRKLESG